MNNQDIERIISGQVNLDRMKVRVKTTVNLLTSLATQDKFIQLRRESGETLKKFESEACVWSLIYQKRDRFVVHCDIKCTATNVSAFYSEQKDGVELCLEQIEKVYDDLPTFVKGMLETFPYLKDALGYHMSAGSKQF